MLSMRPFAHKAVDEEIINRTLITFVRDPVDHFLSGWQECELSKLLKRSNGTMEDTLRTYNDMIQGLSLSEYIRKNIKFRRRKYGSFKYSNSFLILTLIQVKSQNLDLS